MSVLGRDAERASADQRGDRIYLSPPHVGTEERDLLLGAFDSGWIAPSGPDIREFESEFCNVVGVGHSLAVSSGTAALHLALLAIGVAPSDSVLIADFTFVATANAVSYVGARPVFIDADLDSWTVDSETVAAYLRQAERRNDLPRALIAVDLYGQCADYRSLQEICDHYGVLIIEDAAEALGATHNGRSAGQFGAVAAFSFNGNKIITTSGGGMLTTNDGQLARRCAHLATQAREPVLHYEHREVGYNYRMSNLLAAVGRAQLRKLNDRVRRRREIFSFYERQLRDVPGFYFMPEVPYGTSTRWLTCLTIDPSEAPVSRDDIISALAAANIEARPTWKPMHLQPAYAGCAYHGGGHSERLFRSGLCLPSGSSLTDSDLNRIIAVIRRRLLGAE